ncbi:RNA-binding protein [Candidatus Parcubacteria bacterium]|nr:MAG: RNA-binding protein [Candidatus Parcubacteria bacterium]
MSNRLFVAGLSYDLTQDQLSEYFSKAGTVVSANIITDKMTGRSRGFGFVEMSTPEEAENAMKTLDNTELAGRTINVKEAHPQQSRPSGSGFGYGGADRRDSRQRDDRRSKRW